MQLFIYVVVYILNSLVSLWGCIAKFRSCLHEQAASVFLIHFPIKHSPPPSLLLLPFTLSLRPKKNSPPFPPLFEKKRGGVWVVWVNSHFSLIINHFCPFRVFLTFVPAFPSALMTLPPDPQRKCKTWYAKCDSLCTSQLRPDIWNLRSEVWDLRISVKTNKVEKELKINFQISGLKSQVSNAKT